MKKCVVIVFCLILFSSVTLANAEVKNPDTFIKVTPATVQGVDPAYTYNSASSQRIQNIYQGLIAFDGPSTDKFVPVLATEVPDLENGGISPDGKTYMFTIRKGVKFHEGGELTPEDVEYSLERHLIAGGSPMWMLLEALTGENDTLDKGGNILPGIFEEITSAIEVDGDTVILHLPQPYPPLLAVLAGSWSVILDKEWAIEQGCWDGTLENAKKYNNRKEAERPLQRKMNGTGPYYLKGWESSKEFVFERFDGYWGPKPALKFAIIKYVPEWSNRKMMLLNGDADYASVDPMFVTEMADIDGLKRYKVSQLRLSALAFCQKIHSDGNPYIGSGKLDGKGISPDFFTDENVRKAFMHAFDRDLYEKDVLQGIGTIPTNPNIQGLPYHIDVPVYEFDLEKATEYLKKAWDGQVWEKGFEMSFCYNSGDAAREAAALMIAENIMSLNPKFQIEVSPIERKTYLSRYNNYYLPVFFAGWGADYPDPHNFLYTYMHSNGLYGDLMGVNNPEIDELIEEGISTVDPAKRKEIYEKLQNLWYTEANGFCVFQNTTVRHYRDWVQGFVPNPMDGDDSEWFYRLSKEEVK